MKKHFQYWGALYVLAILFVVSLVLHYIFQVGMSGESLSEFGSSVFENWQSEWAQLFVQALLINALAHKIYKADAQDTERIEKKIDKLLEK